MIIKPKLEAVKSGNVILYAPNEVKKMQVNYVSVLKTNDVGSINKYDSHTV